MLLIIFMVTAPVLQSGIEVNVPKTRTVKQITEERLVISINKQQRVFLGNDPVNINEIAAKLREKIRDPQQEGRYEKSLLDRFREQVDEARRGRDSQQDRKADAVQPAGCRHEDRDAIDQRGIEFCLQGAIKRGRCRRCSSDDQRNGASIPAIASE